MKNSPLRGAATRAAVERGAISYTAAMISNAKNPAWNPDRLDVQAMARARGVLDTVDPLNRYARLVGSGVPGTAEGDVAWRGVAELRGTVPWLHLNAATTLSLTCQRCLQPVAVPLAVDRWFRFVADEATAEAEDGDSEEDVLALEPRPSLRELVEDELLMVVPLVPMHGQCPEPLAAAVADAPAPAGQDDKPHPFAALARLKR